MTNPHEAVRVHSPSDGPATDIVLWEVATERKRQDERWGQQDHSGEKWFRILGEEVGEVAKAINEHDVDNYREELIQVAAVAVSAVESLDRNR